MINANPFSGRAIVGVLACVATVACSSTTATDDASGPLTIGTWGGDSAALIVGDTAMHLHIACTFGDFTGRITPDATGQFTAEGSYVLRAFPVQVGPALPAHFLGRRTRNTITGTVVVNDTTQQVNVVRGPVTITLGATPRQLPCPICRDPYGAPLRSRPAAWLRFLR